jgi:hypothetical protein
VIQGPAGVERGARPRWSREWPRWSAEAWRRGSGARSSLPRMDAGAVSWRRLMGGACGTLTVRVRRRGSSAPRCCGAVAEAGAAGRMEEPAQRAAMACMAASTSAPSSRGRWMDLGPWRPRWPLPRGRGCAALEPWLCTGCSSGGGGRGTDGGGGPSRRGRTASAREDPPRRRRTRIGAGRLARGGGYAIPRGADGMRAGYPPWRWRRRTRPPSHIYVRAGWHLCSA